MFVCIPLAMILCRSAVYVKGFDPKKIRGAKKRILSEHIKLWNIIAGALASTDNECGFGYSDIITFNDITKYISNNKILSSSISTDGFTPNDNKYIQCDGYEDIIFFIGMITSEISVMFYSENCDYERLFAFIRALHNLPRCFFSVGDNKKISKTNAIGYMEKELTAAGCEIKHILR